MSASASKERFVAALRKKCRKWSEVAEELGANLGLRAVYFPGTLYRSGLVSGGEAEFFDQIFAQLPKDAAVLDLLDTGQLIHYVPGTSGSYHDTLFFIVASGEWPPTPEGSVIEKFEPVFQSKWVCAGGCGYADNTLERKACEVCGRGRGD